MADSGFNQVWYAYQKGSFGLSPAHIIEILQRKFGFKSQLSIFKIEFITLATMYKVGLFIFYIFSIFPLVGWAQGSLFIIGGGDRPPKMMQRMIAEAKLQSHDHIAILTMSSANPDTSYKYIVDDIRPYAAHVIAKLHFTTADVNNQNKLDSVRKAKLLFITGGVQTRFMNIVWNTPVFKAIHEAYDRGAMIAGTSAGAAVMSEIMITGDQIRADTLYEGAVDRITPGNMETKPGLGFLHNTIIDQHFIVRSRYNRVLTLLSQYPGKMAVGIDEDTAILVRRNNAEVVGNSQVVVFRNQKNLPLVDNKPRFKNMKMSLYGNGDRFKIWE